MSTTDIAKYETAKAQIQAAEKQLTLAQAAYERAQVEVDVAEQRLTQLGFDLGLDLDAQLFDRKSKVIKAGAKLAKDIAKLEGAIDVT